jgi:hypothetical protein
MIRRKAWGIKKGRKLMTDLYQHRAGAKVMADMQKAKVVRIEVRIVEVRGS